ncbi:MAG: hypothetical protein IPK66_03965 [Rhodospirillales bacterium]|nr:hypothetical protein [Rhodospirillales bacterium]
MIARANGKPSRPADAYVIEVEGIAVGVVIQHGQSYRFYAADHAMRELHHKQFPSARAAQRAAERTIASARAVDTVLSRKRSSA